MTENATIKILIKLKKIDELFREIKMTREERDDINAKHLKQLVETETDREETAVARSAIHTGHTSGPKEFYKRNPERDEIEFKSDKTSHTERRQLQNREKDLAKKILEGQRNEADLSGDLSTVSRDCQHLEKDLSKTIKGVLEYLIEQDCRADAKKIRDIVTGREEKITAIEDAVQDYFGVGVRSINYRVHILPFELRAYIGKIYPDTRNLLHMLESNEVDAKRFEKSRRERLERRFTEAGGKVDQLSTARKKASSPAYKEAGSG